MPLIIGSFIIGVATSFVYQKLVKPTPKRKTKCEQERCNRLALLMNRINMLPYRERTNALKICMTTDNPKFIQGASASRYRGYVDKMSDQIEAQLNALVGQYLIVHDGETNTIESN